MCIIHWFINYMIRMNVNDLYLFIYLLNELSLFRVMIKLEK